MFVSHFSFAQAEVADYEIRTSNMAYVSGRVAVLSEFDNILREKYLSSSKTVDFGKSEEVRQEINTAVEKETNSRIKDLIPSGEYHYYHHYLNHH